jgi:hypothetical protein
MMKDVFKRNGLPDELAKAYAKAAESPLAAVSGRMVLAMKKLKSCTYKYIEN